MQPPNRIPADQTQGFTSWQLPEVDDGKAVSVDKGRRPPGGEVVEVEQEEIVCRALTAAQLEEITNQAYEDVRQQAWEEGHREGYERGHQAGMQAARQEVDAQLALLRRSVDSVYQLLDRQDDEVEQALVNLSVSVARAVLRRELLLGNEQIRAVIADAIALLPHDSQKISVFLNPQQHALLMEFEPVPSHWQLVPDPALSPGGCRITNGQSVVDFTLEDQFQQAVNALVERRFAELDQRARADSVEATVRGES